MTAILQHEQTRQRMKVMILGCWSTKIKILDLEATEPFPELSVFGFVLRSFYLLFKLFWLTILLLVAERVVTLPSLATSSLLTLFYFYPRDPVFPPPPPPPHPPHHTHACNCFCKTVLGWDTWVVGMGVCLIFPHFISYFILGQEF